jgi:protein gp37
VGKTTEISWTDHTFNPWWGCVKVSPGCEHCYALSLAKRWGHDIWGPASTTTRRLFGVKHWQEPLAWNAAAEQSKTRRRVFCASMADVFEDHPIVQTERERLWELIRATPWLDWLILTKRPKSIGFWMPPGYWNNVWLGTSTEDQQRANERVPWLLIQRYRVPVLFLSVEPQIGPVTVTRWIDSLDWIIVGGESGPGHRPFDVDWARSLHEECAMSGAAFHYKQFGGFTHAEGGCLLDGREYKEFPRAKAVA